jgi:hypothetical protein
MVFSVSYLKSLIRKNSLRWLRNTQKQKVNAFSSLLQQEFLSLPLQTKNLTTLWKQGHYSTKKGNSMLRNVVELIFFFFFRKFLFQKAQR